MDALQSAGELLQRGGLIVAVLVLLSLISGTVIVYKILELRGWRTGSSEFVDRALQHWASARGRDALTVLQAERGPAARLMHIAIDGLMNEDFSEARVREEVARVAEEYLARMRGLLKVLEVIGSLSPLIGLFGTVVGMIDAFRAIEVASSRVDPSLLSGGIWTALLTTAVGLGVAIPSLTAHFAFESWIETQRRRMEDAVTRVFTQGPVISEEIVFEGGAHRPAPAVAERHAYAPGS